jgi:hypothetical protein
MLLKDHISFTAVPVEYWWIRFNIASY